MSILVQILKSTILTIVAAIVATVGGVYAFEYYASKTDVNYPHYWWQYPQRPIDITNQSVMTIESGIVKNLYANLDYKGVSTAYARRLLPSPSGSHVRSNKFGYYTDYPVDRFPPKQEDEFRIILFGGSAALGYGASSNGKMMYHVLEEKLGKSLADTGKKITVINLGMAGYAAADSLNALRAFGHRLQPDLLLGYAGPNDIGRFHNSYWGEGCGQYYENLLTWTFVGPQWMLDLGNRFPALFYARGLARKIKEAFYSEHYRAQAVTDCLRDLGVDGSQGKLATVLYRDVTVPMFIESVKAIKRDFCGTDIMIAWAALHSGERTQYERTLTEFDPRLNPVVVGETTLGDQARFSFYNADQRVVHFVILPPGAPKPSWETVIRSGPGYSLKSGIVAITDTVGYANLVDISARSESGFNINSHLTEGRQAFYTVVDAGPSAEKPTADFLLKSGTALTGRSVAHNFDPGKTPTVYFVVKSGEAISPVFVAKDHDVVKQSPPPDVYYAMELTPGDQAKEVYSVYTVGELDGFRRNDGVYQKFYKRSRAAINGYLNKYWQFVNVDRLAHAIDPSTVPGMTADSIQVHSDDAGQTVLAGVIAEQLGPVVRALLADPNRPMCNETSAADR